MGKNKIALKLKPSVDPEGYICAHIIVNDEDVLTIWCDHVSKYGGDVYTFDLHGFGVSSLYTKEVEIGKGL